MLTLPLSFRWADLVDALVAERGGLGELVRALYEVHPGELPADPATIERGIRRLRKREARPGDKYGRMLLRHFGLPSSIQAWARELGQYHSRLSDLPASLRRDQLRLWDRPPVSESAEAAWIHIGLAGLAHREGDLDALTRRLELAALVVDRAGLAARLELDLFRARLATDAGDHEHAEALLTEVGARLEDALEILGTHDHACLGARCLDQRAYLRARGWREVPARLVEAEALYRTIPSAGPSFVVFRHHQGVAWSAWRGGRRDEALTHARLAAEAAGDGGYLRLRCVSLRFQARVLGEGDAARNLAERVERIEVSLDARPW